MSSGNQPHIVLILYKIYKIVLSSIKKFLISFLLNLRRYTPSLRDFFAFTLSFTLAASISWLAGGSSAYTGPGDIVSFSDGSLYAPTVRERGPGLLDRISRGFRTIAQPVIPHHDATNFGDQSRVRERSREAAATFLGRDVGVPQASTRGARINGGSSGLAWALAALEMEQPNLFGDRTFAASAMISGHGNAGPVGSLPEKTLTKEMEGTDLLFVHLAQASDARSLFRFYGGHRPVVVGVLNIEQAVGVLCLLGNKGPVCERYRKTSKQPNKERLQVKISALDSSLCYDILRLSKKIQCASTQNAVTLSTSHR
jgi:hypothetical protein